MLRDSGAVAGGALSPRVPSAAAAGEPVPGLVFAGGLSGNLSHAARRALGDAGCGRERRHVHRHAPGAGHAAPGAARLLRRRVCSGPQRGARAVLHGQG